MNDDQDPMLFGQYAAAINAMLQRQQSDDVPPTGDGDVLAAAEAIMARMEAHYDGLLEHRAVAQRYGRAVEALRMAERVNLTRVILNALYEEESAAWLAVMQAKDLKFDGPVRVLRCYAELCDIAAAEVIRRAALQVPPR